MSDKTSEPHNLSCVFLACATSILKAGLEKLLYEAVEKAKELSPSRILHLCTKVLFQQSENVLSSLNRLIERYRVDSSCTYSQKLTIINRSSSTLDRASVLFFSDIDQKGPHGRQVNALQGIGRGITVLKETPYICTPETTCNCHEEGLLSEHLTMGFAMANDLSENFTLAGSNLAHSNEWKQDQLIDLQVGMISDGLPEVFKIEGCDSGGQSKWSIHMVCLFATVSSVMALYKLASVGQSAVSIDVSNSTFIRKTGQIFKILCRLPHNVHAVSRVVRDLEKKKIQIEKVSERDRDKERDKGRDVGGDVNKYRIGESTLSKEHMTGTEGAFVSSSSNTFVLRQIRVGYALFLHASSINHSCTPNATIRFSSSSRSADASEHLSSVSPTSLLSTLNLRDVYVEIVVTRSIRRGEEVSVSYGPLRGRHNLEDRRRCLLSQYMFYCQCDGCSTDEKELTAGQPCEHSTDVNTSTTATTTRGTDKESPTSHLYTAMPPFSTCRLSRTGRDALQVVDAEALQRALLGIRDDLNKLNSDWTVVLEMNRREYKRGKSCEDEGGVVQNFERDRITPIGLKIAKLRYDHRLDSTDTDENITNKLTVELPGSQAIVSKRQAKELYLFFCSLICCFLDVSANAQAQRERYAVAADMVTAAIRTMVDSHQYQNDDVVVGRERVKLAQLLFNAGTTLIPSTTCTLRNDNSVGSSSRINSNSNSNSSGDTNERSGTKRVAGSHQEQGLMLLSQCKAVLTRALQNLSPFVDRFSDPDWVEGSSMLQFLFSLPYPLPQPPTTSLHSIH